MYLACVSELEVVCSIFLHAPAERITVPFGAWARVNEGRAAQLSKLKLDICPIFETVIIGL
jgi:hypothetical protein